MKDVEALLRTLDATGERFRALIAENKKLHEMCHDAWGIIANAENFKHTLVCANRHCAEREHEHVPGMTEAIGSPDWREAATRWRDAWHGLVGVGVGVGTRAGDSQGTAGHMGDAGDADMCPAFHERWGVGCTRKKGHGPLVGLKRGLVRDHGHENSAFWNEGQGRLS